MLAMAGNGVQLEEDRGRPHHQKSSAVSFQNGHHHRRLESGPAGGGGGGGGGRREGGRVGGGGGEGERGRRGGGGGGGGKRGRGGRGRAGGGARGGARGESHSHCILGRVISTTTTTTTSRERARRALRRALPASASVLGLAGVFWVIGTLLWGRRRYRIQPTDSPAFWGFQSRGPVTADSNRCADLDISLFDKAMVCGWPLSSPCFQHFRCTPKVEGERAGGGGGQGKGEGEGEGGEGSRGVGMYVYDSECSLADSEMLSVDGLDRNGEKLGHHEMAWYWRKALKDAGLLAATYDAACMFIHVNWVGVEPCAAEAPLWNGGANHVMVDFSDKSRDSRLAVVNSFAMEAASNMHTCFYRTGYDIAMPLAPKMVFHYLTGVAPLERKYFLTFKGTLYLNRHGSEERVSLRPLHDEPNGVITALSCFELHKKHLLEENIEYCESLKHRYDSFDYDKLMNTTFGLVPGGRSPGTYRLAEVMSAGAIPVFVARDIIQPFREQYDWPSFSFSFAPTDVWSSLVKTLRAVSREQLAEMQRKSLEAYWEIFGGKEQDFVPIARKMVEVLQQRIGHRG